MKPKLGILGAGKLGIVLAQRAVAVGYPVTIASSKPAQSIKLTVSVLAPGATAADSGDVIQHSDVIILALPLSKFRNLDPSLFKNKLVIDAMNYWWEVDGPRDTLIPAHMSSSEAVQAYFKKARVVKALSHMGYHELHDMAQPILKTDRKAIAIAGDNQHDMSQVATIVDDFGFDPLFIGKLAQGKILEPGQPGFGTALSKNALQQRLENQTQS